MTNSKRPDQAPVPHEQAKPMGPADGSPQALPTEDILNVPASVESEEEKLKRMARETAINTSPPEPENVTGPDTTGVGQPSIQPVNQGQSLPQSAVPVEKKFEKEQFHDPMATERAVVKKDIADRGGKKADL